MRDGVITSYTIAWCHACPASSTGPIRADGPISPYLRLQRYNGRQGKEGRKEMQKLAQSLREHYRQHRRSVCSVSIGTHCMGTLADVDAEIVELLETDWGRGAGHTQPQTQHLRSRHEGFAVLGVSALSENGKQTEPIHLSI